MIKRLWLGLAVTLVVAIAAPADAQQAPSASEAKGQEAQGATAPDVAPLKSDQARPKAEADAAREADAPSAGGPAGCRYRPSKLELIV